MSPQPAFIERSEPTAPGWRRIGAQHLRRYEFALELTKGKRVLDLACGAGFGSYVLARNGALEVIGVDISDEAIGYATAHYRRENLAYVKADAQTFAGAAPFDVVVSFETIEHVPEPAKLIEAFARNLAPGGMLVLSAPNCMMHKRRPGAPWDSPFHLHEPSYEELVAWVSGAFVIMQEFEQSPVYFDSAVHADSAHLLRSSVLINGLLRFESLLRTVFGKPWPARPEGTRLERWSEIMPLLPSRAEQAEVFLLVCQRRG